MSSEGVKTDAYVSHGTSTEYLDTDAWVLRAVPVLEKAVSEWLSVWVLCGQSIVFLCALLLILLPSSLSLVACLASRVSVFGSWVTNRIVG